jgi:uncharacterized protein (DUF1499 family)
MSSNYKMMLSILFYLFVIHLNGDNLSSSFSLKKISKLATSFASVGFFVAGINIDDSLAAAAAAAAPTPTEKAAEQLFGLKKDRLLSCKQSSNCISSSAFRSLEHYGKPWSFSDSNSADQEFDIIVSALQSLDFRLKVVDTNREKYYVRAEARSTVPVTGTDDIEFLINPIDKIITYRTNSREVP